MLSKNRRRFVTLLTLGINTLGLMASDVVVNYAGPDEELAGIVEIPKDHPSFKRPLSLHRLVVLVKEEQDKLPALRHYKRALFSSSSESQGKCAHKMTREEIIEKMRNPSGRPRFALRGDNFLAQPSVVVMTEKEYDREIERQRQDEALPAKKTMRVKSNVYSDEHAY